MYWSDYFGDTMHLTTEQHGAYLLLLGAYWLRGGPLPADDAYLKQVTRAGKRWGHIKPVVLAFFDLEELSDVDFGSSDNRLTVPTEKTHNRFQIRHKRLEKEILKSSERLKSARASGRAGGLAKSYLATATATATQKRKRKKQKEFGQISENPTDNVSKNLPVISDAGSSKAVVKTRADQFDEWWSHWTITGTKRGKEGAKRKFKVVMKNGSPTLDELCDGLDRYMAYCAAEKTEVQHIIHPERFLSKGYWNNDYPAPRRTEGDVLQDLYEKYQRKDAEDGDVR